MPELSQASLAAIPSLRMTSKCFVICLAGGACWRGPERLLSARAATCSAEGLYGAAAWQCSGLGRQLQEYSGALGHICEQVVLAPHLL